MRYQWQVHADTGSECGLLHGPMHRPRRATRRLRLRVRSAVAPSLSTSRAIPQRMHTACCTTLPHTTRRSSATFIHSTGQSSENKDASTILVRLTCLQTDSFFLAPRSAMTDTLKNMVCFAPNYRQHGRLRFDVSLYARCCFGRSLCAVSDAQCGVECEGGEGGGERQAVHAADRRDRRAVPLPLPGQPPLHPRQRTHPPNPSARELSVNRRSLTATRTLCRPSRFLQLSPFSVIWASAASSPFLATSRCRSCTTWSRYAAPVRLPPLRCRSSSA